MSKICSKCSKDKGESLFYKKKSSKDGLASQCKECSNKQVGDFIKTKKGLALRIYTTQISSSKKRNHKPPSYTKEELYNWILKQSNFQELYDNWVNSGYSKKLKPSVDRLKDDEGYTLINIRLTTLECNRETFREKIIKGNISITSKKVKQIISDSESKDFHSIKEAERITGVHNPSIVACCKGQRKTAGGFKWEYITN